MCLLILWSESGTFNYSSTYPYINIFSTRFPGKLTIVTQSDFMLWHYICLPISNTGRRPALLNWVCQCRVAPLHLSSLYLLLVMLTYLIYRLIILVYNLQKRIGWTKQDTPFIIHPMALRPNAMASSFLRFLDHTQRRITVGRTPLDAWLARHRELYLTTHNTHNRQTSMPPVGFEPIISVEERP